MGASNGPAGFNGRRSMMSDINVTPMVDVMLVLLIIFMVAAPMMTQGLEVDLPKADNQALQTEDRQTVVTIAADGAVFIDEYRLPGTDDLGLKVKQNMETKGARMVYIRADKNVPYGRVAEVMSEMRGSGITNVGLVTDPLGNPPPASAKKSAAGRRAG